MTSAETLGNMLLSWANFDTFIFIIFTVLHPFVTESVLHIAVLAFGFLLKSGWRNLNLWRLPCRFLSPCLCPHARKQQSGSPREQGAGAHRDWAFSSPKARLETAVCSWNRGAGCRKWCKIQLCKLLSVGSWVSVWDQTQVSDSASVWGVRWGWFALSDSRIHFQSCLGAACIVLALYVGFLAELGPQLMLSFDFHDKFSSRRFTAQLLWFARLMLWNAGWQSRCETFLLGKKTKD